MNRYFMVGTDTDCGKTYVTAQWVRYLQHQGRRALAIKPVASGCLMRHDGTLLSDDAQQLERANGSTDHIICPWRFLLPMSPHLAAKEAGVTLSLKAIADFCLSDAFADVDDLLIEGAGGLMVPLNAEHTWLDFLMHTRIPVVLVVGMRLGCINHALLTAMALKTHGITCIGWVANALDDTLLGLSDNIATLSEKIEWPLLAVIPFGGTWSD
jgi:dethiobiotin synthetase